MHEFRITSSIDYSFLMQTFDICEYKGTGKYRADISWDARNDALSYEQLCYYGNQDFLKTWSPMWVPWLPLSFQLFNKLPNNALLRFPPFWSSVSGFTAHSHFSSASSHIQSPLSNHRFDSRGGIEAQSMSHYSQASFFTQKMRKELLKFYSWMFRENWLLFNLVSPNATNLPCIKENNYLARKWTIFFSPWYGNTRKSCLYMHTWNWVITDYSYHC